EAKFYEQIMANPRRLPAMLLPRLRDHDRPGRAREVYAALVERIHQDGWRVENYQFPLIADERNTGSTFLQSCSEWSMSAPTARYGCSTRPSCARSDPDCCGATAPERMRSRSERPAAARTSKAIPRCPR